jgi:two-component system chemotaxis sensor kinase CheA
VTAQAPSESTTVRVEVEKIDDLMNQVGELVITKAMLDQAFSQMNGQMREEIQNGLAQLDRNTRDLQESIMSVRMVPIQMVFGRFPRVARDLAGKTKKQVELKINGAETEIDKGFIEKLVDPITHLVRNSVDHGLETPERRVEVGKDAKGVVTLTASHQGGNVVIEVSDDGGGLNREKILRKARNRGIPINESMTDQEVWQLVFTPGFSTAETVTDVSGRGVGLDVVKKNIRSIGGKVEIHSEEGRGTTFTIQLPLTTAIIEGMTVRVGSEVYIIPFVSIVESIRPKETDLKTVMEKGEVVQVRGGFIMVLRLYQIFGVSAQFTDPSQAVLVILESQGERVAVLVDELLGKQQVVIKSMEKNFKKVEGIAAATILGDGKVAFILDVNGLLGLIRKESKALA